MKLTSSTHPSKMVLIFFTGILVAALAAILAFNLFPGLRTSFYLFERQEMEPNSPEYTIAKIEEEAKTYPSAPAPAVPDATFTRSHPGSAQRKCVSVNEDAVVRSGEFIAGDFQLYINRIWEPNMRPDRGKLWFHPLHQQEMGVITVEARLLDATQQTQSYTSEDMAGNSGGGFYPTGLHLPIAGRWIVVAKSGPDWGCFDLTVGE